MRLILSIVLSLSLTATFAQSSGPVWTSNLMEAVDRSISEKKPLLLFFTGSDWCGWCKKLQAEVFLKPEFDVWAKKNVILVELDFPRRTALSSELQQQNAELQQMFQVRGYPTIWLVNPTRQDSNVNFAKLGSTGFVAGGPVAWIATADQILLQAR
ncbi:MAG: thioredoxin family protein [Flavobacteriales bacterium]|nr:thioredoxin family protein [Flavobacteriales bacterium]